MAVVSGEEGAGETGVNTPEEFGDKLYSLSPGAPSTSSGTGAPVDNNPAGKPQPGMSLPGL